MPPFRVRGGLRYQRNAFQAGGEVMRRGGAGSRVGPRNADRRLRLLKLYASYSVQSGAWLHTITARAGQRDQRALPEPPVAHQGPDAGDGPELQAALQREVLEGDGRRVDGWEACRGGSMPDQRRSAAMSAGSGASIVMRLARHRMRHRDAPGVQRLTGDARVGRPYTRSPTIGQPRAARCTRIWWVRPVTSSQRTSGARAADASTS